MKTNPRILGIFAAAAVMLALSGCGTTKRATVSEAPPAPQQETVPVAPNANSLWVEGHWTRQSDQWVWQSGRWMLRPNARAIWEPGSWDQTKNGWVWRDGRWRDNNIP